MASDASLERKVDEFTELVRAGKLDRDRANEALKALSLEGLDVFTLDQAAAFLQVSRATFYTLIKQGRVKGVRIGDEAKRGRWRFTRRSLLEMVDAH